MASVKTIGVKRALRAFCAVSLAAIAALSALAASSASAETYPASNTEALAGAVAKANSNPGANTIKLSAGVIYSPAKTLTFTNTTGVQTIEGPSTFPGAKLEGGSVEPLGSELMVVKASVSVTLKNIVVTTAGSGGVPAIDDFGSLDLESSSVSGNNGPGVHVEGGAAATVTNSTLSDGLDFALLNSGTTSFLNSTVAFNNLGGIENKGTLNLTNTIVAENKGSGDCVGTATTSDHSLDSDGSCGVGALSKMNPLLGKLVNDGGPTQIHSLQPGSPAIDAGDKAACPATDQRGQPRPDILGTPCDIGADEYNATPPVIKVPTDITTPATSSKGAIVTFTVEVTSSDDAVRSMSCSPEPGSEFPIGTTTVTCTAKDGHETEATASFKVTVTPQSVGDTTPPVIVVPETLTVSASGAGGAVVSYTVTATDPDNASSELKLSCVPPSGSMFPVGETTVECTAEDPAHNKSSASFKVIVKDTVAPVISGVPADIVVAATGPEGAVVSYKAPTASDDVDGSVPVTCVPESGSLFKVGVTTVECSATDKAGNKSTASFKVTVTPQSVGDTTPPVIVVPETLTVSASGAGGAVVSYTVTATDPDNAASELKLSCTPASGAMFPVGETMVECTAEDPAHNKASASFKVIVKDTVPPVISGVPADIVVEATGTGGAVVSYKAPTASDDVDGSVPVSCVPESGSLFKVGVTTVECSATDKAGNKSTASFKVTVTPQSVGDTTPPVIVVPETLTVSASGAGGAVVSYTVTATDPDNAASELKLSCTPASGAMFPVGETMVECTAEDPAHNKASASFKVIVTRATEDPALVLGELLREVSDAPIPHHIRFELSDRLADALDSLTPNDPRTVGDARDHRTGQRACRELDGFLELIARDQRRERPRIPAALASAWTKTVLGVEVSLGCDSDSTSDSDSSDGR